MHLLGHRTPERRAGQNHIQPALVAIGRAGNLSECPGKGVHIMEFRVFHLMQHQIHRSQRSMVASKSKTEPGRRTGSRHACRDHPPLPVSLHLFHPVECSSAQVFRRLHQKPAGSAGRIATVSDGLGSISSTMSRVTSAGYELAVYPGRGKLAEQIFVQIPRNYGHPAVLFPAVDSRHQQADWKFQKRFSCIRQTGISLHRACADAETPHRARVQAWRRRRAWCSSSSSASPVGPPENGAAHRPGRHGFFQPGFFHIQQAGKDQTGNLPIIVSELTILRGKFQPEPVYVHFDPRMDHACSDGAFSSRLTGRCSSSSSASPADAQERSPAQQPPAS